MAGRGAAGSSERSMSGLHPRGVDEAASVWQRRVGLLRARKGMILNAQKLSHI